MAHCDAETFDICSDRLAIELARPGSAIQKGSRFDLSGHMVQVTLDGTHTFSAPEDFDAGRGSGGLGFCNEFWDFNKTLYHSARPGARFPKMGVGLLLRETDGDFDFMTHYPKQPYPIEVTVGPDTATFTVQGVECNGYAARIHKTLAVRGASLTVDYRFENVGALPIDVLEYNHNFVLVDGHPVGPDYRLRLPYAVEMAETPDTHILDVRGSEISWKGEPDGAFYCQPRVPAGTRAYAWELTHMPSGVGMRETDDFPVHHVALWGKRHVVSTEVFIQVNLQPGESLGWRRRYDFFAEKPEI